MTLHFNSLVFIPSDHCNISCGHCAPECGPTLKHGWSIETFKQCITDAKKIPNLSKMVHFAGGEPFLYFNNMIETAQHAKRSGFLSSIVTNGFWAYSDRIAREQIAALVEAGLYRAELSCDSFHLEFIPIGVIKNAIRILKDAGVMTTLRVITTRAHMLDELLKMLNKEDLDGLHVSGAPIVPIGRALTAVPSQDYYLKTDGATGHCSDSLNLTVRSDGHVAVCCAGSDLTPSLWIGNINTTPIDIIAKEVEWNMLIKKIVHQGPSSFFAILKQAGLEHKIKPSYTNICHACSELFNDDEVVAAVKKWIFEVQQSCLTEEFGDVNNIELAKLFNEPNINKKELIQIKPLDS